MSMTAVNIILILVGLLALSILLLWATDQAMVHRWFGEPPTWAWHLRWKTLQTIRGAADIPQMITLTGIAIILLGMWAYAHPHVRQHSSGKYLEVYWLPRSVGDASGFDQSNWNVRWARNQAKELRYERLIPYEHEKYGTLEHSESVSITVRDYWAKHIVPRKFYRLEVTYQLVSEAIVNPEAGSAEDGKNPRISYFAGTTGNIFFVTGDKQYGPIVAEQGVNRYHAVSYNRGKIIGLLAFMQANPGPYSVRVEFVRNKSVVERAQFVTPGDLSPFAVDVLTGKSKPKMITLVRGLADD